MYGSVPLTSASLEDKSGANSSLWAHRPEVGQADYQAIGFWHHQFLAKESWNFSTPLILDNSREMVGIE
jgi:hypothetical protein